MRPIQILLVSCVPAFLILSSCSSVPRTAPRFTVPDTAPIKKAIAVTQSKQASVGQKIQKAQQTITLIANDCPGAKAEIDLLSSDLMEAYADNKEAEMSIMVLKGANEQLEGELTQQVQQANQMAKDCDKCQVDKQALAESRHSWVKRFWIAALVAAGALALVIKPWRFI